MKCTWYSEGEEGGAGVGITGGGEFQGCGVAGVGIVGICRQYEGTNLGTSRSLESSCAQLCRFGKHMDEFRSAEFLRSMSMSELLHMHSIELPRSPLG